VLTEQQRKFLEISYKNLLKLERISTTFWILPNGLQKASWTFEPVDLAKVIEFSCTTVEPLAEEHQIRLEAHLLQDRKIAGVKTNSTAL